MGKIIAVANQKGGVGKTTTAVNLAACVAAAGRNTLLVDLDPQGNATQGLGVEKNLLDRHVYHLLVDAAPANGIIQETSHAGLRLLPANRDMVGAEIELVEAERREFRLQQGIQDLASQFDYIFIDCPPSLGLLTLNGLVAADGVLVPIQCEYYALEGLSEVLQTIMRVRDNLNPRLGVLGILMTMYQHTNLSKQVVEDVRGHLGPKVFDTVIPRNVALSEAPSYGQPIIYHDLKSTGAQAYLALARELIARG